MVLEWKADVKGSLSDALRDVADTKKFQNVVSKKSAPPVEQSLFRRLTRPAPPRRDRQFVWSGNPNANARARRWWFANVRAGRIPTDGRHYTRSGKINQDWTILVLQVGDAINILVSNPAEGSEFVYGSPTQRQVPGHEASQWPNLNRTIKAAQALLIENINEDWSEYLKKSLKRKRK